MFIKPSEIVVDIIGYKYGILGATITWLFSRIKQNFTYINCSGIIIITLAFDIYAQTSSI